MNYTSVNYDNEYDVDVGGRYCHQTSTLFTIITIQIQFRQTTKKGRQARWGQ